MTQAVWAARNGVALVCVYHWFHAELLPLPVQRVSRLILVDEPAGKAGVYGCTAVYARASSTDQKPGLDRQVAQVTAWATTPQNPGRQVVTGRVCVEWIRRKFLALLRDRSVTRLLVEHRVVFCGFDSEYVQAALDAHGRELVIVDTAEVDDDPVCGATEILNSMCARLCGKRAEQNRATPALAPATTDDPVVA